MSKNKPIIVTREEFTDMFGDHPDWLWEGLVQSYNRLNLSERVRPDVEAAPWVVEEIKSLEAENARLREALERIAIGGCECCTDGSLHRDEMIDEARAALEGEE